MEQAQERHRLGPRPLREEADAGAEAHRSRPLSALRALMLPAILVAIAAVALFGYLFWHEQTLYVSTDNALITGTMVQVPSPGAGQVRTVDVDIGDQVEANQLLATLSLPNQVWVRAPIDGVVVARQSNPGDMVTGGRSIVTIADPSQVWVQAQIEETQIGRVRAGQIASVSIDSLGETVEGRVIGVGRAASSSLQPQSNGQNLLTRTRQLVPVKIELPAGELPLVVGGSVGVRIRVQD